MSTARASAVSSRRATNQSTSSTNSNGSSRSERGDRSERTRTGPPAVESAVTRLLVSIKQLLESLTKWSASEVDESFISDVYVRLGNDFNGAVAAFAMYRIEMTELMGVPEALRAVLETCLSEEATKETLDQYLPKVRGIITDLLQGLRQKQSMYRRIVSDSRHRSSGTDGGSDRDSRASRSDRSSRRQVEQAVANGEGSEGSRSGDMRRSTPAAKRKDVPSMQAGAANEEVPAARSSTPVQASSRPQTPVQPRPQLAAVQSYSSPRVALSDVSEPTPSRVRSASAIQSSQTNGFHDRDATPRHHSLHESRHSEDTTPIPTPPLPQPQARPPSGVPAHVKRYSLTDRPVTSPTPPPAVVVDEPTSPPIEQTSSQAESPQINGDGELPSSDSQTLAAEPGVQTSLAALRDRTTLERRASKRFSSYNFAKMVGGGSLRERPSGSGSSTPNRRSLAVSSALSPGDLAVLTEAEEDGANSATPSPVRRTRSKSRQPPRNPSPIAEEEEAPPVPALPPREPTPQAPLDVPFASAAAAGSPKLLTVFLQVGREVKKATFEPGMTQSSLKLLFVDKFSYNPGQDNFPAIYIRDPSSGVQYELENMDEIKDRCSLDQIKQHIDLQMASLAQEMKDLRAAVSTNRRASMPPPMIIAQPLAESTPATARPSDHQFRKVARRLSRLLPDDVPFFEEESTPMAPQITGASIQPQMTGASVTSEYTNRVVTDLKTQFDEVQNLRRDLGIMRQLYTEFMKQTKDSLGQLRTQTQNVRQLASNKIGGARQYIDDGKAKLDTRSQTVLTKMEELQDTVENIKDDVIKRSVTPKPWVLKNIKGDMEATVKPMWKKTWEEELQNIVEEQQFLQHQEEFLSDLLEDNKAVIEVWGHVEKIISLRGNASARASRSKGFKPPPMDAGHTGLSTVMLEIRGAAADQERRLKAIAATEKAREKELASRSDEFQNELSGFVDGKKLKRTGGAEEVERVRQRRNEQTLKAMFTGGSTASANDSGMNSVPASPLSP
ncbi:actin interacting protein 3-domain-containing protein [Fomitopsis serialis]|uniref:actin interacting protein 3-domain-containing protein n=1 Tax=Fomitopsis serialis TaxID=139415 RepID=UPI00200826F0|nr:actin interacting protein 3-domain-containing protein [Neoantrodia serialis]KAH9931784.1 actin interacting protein 3-domain-containing protein [Neoantrodia serialis]